MKIIKIPSSQGSLDKNLGCEKAPEVLCRELGVEGEEVEVVAGDIVATDGNVYSKAREVIRENPFFMGGDHSITYSLFRAFSENFENSSLIVFDAHADAMKGIKPVSHEDMNRELIDDGLLEKEKLLLVGLRKIWEQEQEFLEEKGIKAINSRKIHNDFDKAKIEMKNFVEEQNHIYLSIDLDVLDPKIFPATGYLERGGLSVDQLLELIGLVFLSGKVRAIDLVEFNPEKDEDGKGLVAAKKVTEKIVNSI
ncbi:MAG: arginase family protein [Candidatus Diapherotrites archaeon]